jgi:hypothetical protein
MPPFYPNMTVIRLICPAFLPEIFTLSHRSFLVLLILLWLRRYTRFPGPRPLPAIGNYLIFRREEARNSSYTRGSPGFFYLALVTHSRTNHVVPPRPQYGACASQFFLSRL